MDESTMYENQPDSQSHSDPTTTRDIENTFDDDVEDHYHEEENDDVICKSNWEKVLSN